MSLIIVALVSFDPLPRLLGVGGPFEYFVGALVAMPPWTASAVLPACCLRAWLCMPWATGT